MYRTAGCVRRFVRRTLQGYCSSTRTEVAAARLHSQSAPAPALKCVTHTALNTLCSCQLRSLRSVALPLSWAPAGRSRHPDGSAAGTPPTRNAATRRCLLSAGVASSSLIREWRDVLSVVGDGVGDDEVRFEQEGEEGGRHNHRQLARHAKRLSEPRRRVVCPHDRRAGIGPGDGRGDEAAEAGVPADASRLGLRQPAVEHPVGVEHLLNDDTRPLVELEALRASRGTRGRVPHQRPGLAASASGRAQGWRR
mmetsp:Transcript_47804/g.158386  ORF Transcript_47804/g.158386 Transcript_47804/m.158386 type:complete len:252 (+) Transcript_47804:1192-1947(+)